MKKSINIAKSWGPGLFWIGLLAFWEVTAGLNLYPTALLPPPGKIFSALVKDWPLIQKHLIFTLWLTWQGLLLGIGSGLVTAFVVDKFPRFKPYIWPFLTISQTLPPFLIYPLLLLLLGFGETPRVLIAALVCYFPVAVSFAQGLKQTDPDKMELFRNMGAKTLVTYRFLRIPSALPALAGGIKVAAAYSVVGVVFGEMMGGPMEGMGYYMIRKIDTFQPAAVYGAVVLISLVTLLIIKFFEIWEQKLLSKRNRSEE
ncbi:MAG: hypothetical protein A2Z96_07675 [Spirochaetes bacterium GWB1_48_6]|nr:MAG: hypothetical protein A2Z96_07675 [Spirochaetes bacterium GWB1_48_6]